MPMTVTPALRSTAASDQRVSKRGSEGGKSLRWTTEPRLMWNEHTMRRGSSGKTARSATPPGSRAGAARLAVASSKEASTVNRDLMAISALPA
ncbi:hypothetical protein VTK73DRAFT_5853 [Phialemonium thermophilum]|uniref:Uncharacterized protein n=1 Tax=Phialemonium thermophilum TaxID=223376 RepID=A0ABR3V1D7_9PEZI